MENSVKALSILWSLLIGIIILSVMVLVFTKGGQLLFSVDNSKEAENIAAYNAKILAFVSDESYTDEGGILHTDYKTIFDVISAINLAEDINKQNDYDVKNTLEIKVTKDYVFPVGDLILKNNTIPDKQSLIRDYGQKIKNIASEWEWEYKVEGRIPDDGYNEDGKICKIIFNITKYSI